MRDGRTSVMDPLAGLREYARAEVGAADVPAPLPGFAASSFNPLTAEVAGRCLGRRAGSTAELTARSRRTAVILASVHGDLATAAEVAAAVDAGRRVPPLLFYQSVPNSVAGHIAAAWGLAGPVVCISPVGDPLAEALGVAGVLFDDGDADEALLVITDQGTVLGGHDTARAVLVGPADQLTVPDGPADGSAVPDGPADGPVVLNGPAGRPAVLDGPAGRPAVLDGPAGRPAVLSGPADGPAAPNGPAGRPELKEEVPHV